MDFNSMTDCDNTDYTPDNNIESPVQSYNHDDFNINFMGRIDDLYDPHIDRAKENFNQHAQDFLDADTQEKAQWAINRMKEDTNSANYWEECKRSAQIEAEKDKIFTDGINARLDIINKYRK